MKNFPKRWKQLMRIYIYVRKKEGTRTLMLVWGRKGSTRICEAIYRGKWGGWWAALTIPLVDTYLCFLDRPQFRSSVLPYAFSTSPTYINEHYVPRCVRPPLPSHPISTSHFLYLLVTCSNSWICHFKLRTLTGHNNIIDP